MSDALKSGWGSKHRCIYVHMYICKYVCLSQLQRRCCNSFRLQQNCLTFQTQRLLKHNANSRRLRKRPHLQLGTKSKKKNKINKRDFTYSYKAFKVDSCVVDQQQISKFQQRECEKRKIKRTSFGWVVASNGSWICCIIFAFVCKYFTMRDVIIVAFAVN